MNDDDLSQLTQRHATRYAASDRLRSAVRTQIALQSAARSDAPTAPGGKLEALWRKLSWRSAGFGFALGMAMTVALTWLGPRLMTEDSLPAALVAEHVRALKVGPLFEVASSDRHTVKPWFQGKLDYAPQVIDLQAHGFPLLGGRVDHIQGKVTAALAYRQGRHIINVFVWPEDRSSGPQHTPRSGFNVVHWSEAGMQVWAVSDMEAKELDRFSQAWRAGVSPP
jgi:anti-sigma factor RsiW